MTKRTHGSPELDADAAKLEAMGADAGPTFSNEYSVCQFFTDGSYEYVRRNVGAEEAVNAAKHYTESIAVQLVIVERVIITDGDDFICFEWQRGKGVMFK